MQTSPYHEMLSTASITGLADVRAVGVKVFSDENNIV